MKSSLPGVTKTEILRYLFTYYRDDPESDFYHVERGVKEIQEILKSRLPTVYQKNSNLTMVRRHLRDLVDDGLIEEVKVPGDYSRYRITSNGLNFVADYFKEEMTGFIKAVSEVKAFEYSLYTFEKLMKEFNPLNKDPLIGDLPNDTVSKIQKNSDGSFIIPLSAIPKLLERI